MATGDGSDEIGCLFSGTIPWCQSTSVYYKSTLLGPEYEVQAITCNSTDTDPSTHEHLNQTEKERKKEKGSAGSRRKRLTKQKKEANVSFHTGSLPSPFVAARRRRTNRFCDRWPELELAGQLEVTRCWCAA